MTNGMHVFVIHLHHIYTPPSVPGVVVLRCELLQGVYVAIRYVGSALSKALLLGGVNWTIVILEALLSAHFGILCDKG